MTNISNKIDAYTKNRTAGKRLYLALKIKGISRTKKGLFSDDEWIKRNLPKTAKSLSAWFEDGIPIYSKGKNIRPIDAIAEYFRTDHNYFTDDEDISDENFLDKIINTPTTSELIAGNSPGQISAEPIPDFGKPVHNELAELHNSLRQVSEAKQNRKKEFVFFKKMLWKKIQSDMSNFAKSDFIEITSIHQMPPVWIECHEHIEKSLIMTSYANIEQWVNHPNTRKAFEKEVRLASQGIRIRRIYIYDTPEELQTLSHSENVLLQIRGNIELKFISYPEIRDFYYIKDIVAGIEVIDAGLIDETWLFLAFLDATRNPVKLKLCWNSIKVDEYRTFLNELWQMARTVEIIT